MEEVEEEEGELKIENRRTLEAVAGKSVSQLRLLILLRCVN